MTVESPAPPGSTLRGGGPTLVIGADSFLALRNLRLAGLEEHLPDHRFIVLVDPRQIEGSAAVAHPRWEVQALEAFELEKEPALHGTLMRAHAVRKAGLVPGSSWQIYRRRAHELGKGSTLRTARHLAAQGREFGMRWLEARQGKIPELRASAERTLQSHPLVKRYAERLRDMNADVVLSMSAEAYRETMLLEGARAAGIPAVIIIRSRDNLVAKIAHLPHAEAYGVWSELMAEQFYRLYPEVPREKVHVTGAAQFVRHGDPRYRMERDAFFELIGLDPSRPLIAYTCATPGLIPHEKHIVQHLADAVAEEKLARRAQLLIRQHPRGFGSDALQLDRVPSGVSVYPPPGPAPFRGDDHEAEVVKLIVQDEPVHLSTIAYQDVQVNVCGTMSVDSSLLDKPVVNVLYDIPASTPVGLSVKRFYKRWDYAELVRTGGIRMVRSPEECLAAVNDYLAHPEKEREGRKRIAQMEGGSLDGKSGLRIAELVRQAARTGVAA